MNSRGSATTLTFIALFVAMTVGAAPTVVYYHNNLVGSPVAASDAMGRLVWHEDYHPFGERLVGDPAAQPNDIWFTSRRQDTDTGLIYMGSRYYDPVAGRFIATDPKLFDEADIHSFNRYAYANDNPYRYIDLNGRWSTEVHNQIIDAAFPNLSSRERDWIKSGSHSVDLNPLGQIPGLGSLFPGLDTAYQHAMRDDERQTRQEAEALMWHFVDTRMDAFHEWADWEALGAALHPIMDSTSPSHEGFQVYSLENLGRHGNFSKSEEATITHEQLERTIRLIGRVMNGEHKLDK